MKFKFKQIKPELKNENWVEMEAECIVDAIQNHHELETYCHFEHDVCSCLHCWVDKAYTSERIHVRIYKDEDGKEYTSKIYTSGIYRKSLVRSEDYKSKRIVCEQCEQVAKEINMTVEELLFDNWNEL